MRQSINFVQKSIDLARSVYSKAYTVLKHVVLLQYMYCNAGEMGMFFTVLL